MNNPVLERLRQALGRTPGSPVALRPAVPSPRTSAGKEEEINRLISEIQALSGVATHINPSQCHQALQELVATEHIQKAALWQHARLETLAIPETLHQLGVEIISTPADKRQLAACDLGVTTVDFALPETGSLGLWSSVNQPRAVSLLPRVHLAIIESGDLRADLHQVFTESKGRGYMVFVTGPSRTADIELNVTLGVHGPKKLYAWVVE